MTFGERLNKNTVLPEENCFRSFSVGTTTVLGGGVRAGRGQCAKEWPILGHSDTKAISAGRQAYGSTELSLKQARELCPPSCIR